jgi:hypothetical protein
MSLLYIVNGDYGQVIELTFMDVDTDAAADISNYSTTIQMVFVSPAGVSTAKTATFKTDGTNGVIQYTTESGFLTTGQWTVRGKVASGVAVLTTVLHHFEVLA